MSPIIWSRRPNLVGKFENSYTRKLLHNLVEHDEDEVHSQGQIVNQEGIRSDKNTVPLQSQRRTQGKRFPTLCCETPLLRNTRRTLFLA
jgi:hypothetical protein